MKVDLDALAKRLIAKVGSDGAVVFNHYELLATIEALTLLHTMRVIVTKEV